VKCATAHDALITHGEVCFDYVSGEWLCNGRGFRAAPTSTRSTWFVDLQIPSPRYSEDSGSTLSSKAEISKMSGLTIRQHRISMAGEVDEW